MVYFCCLSFEYVITMTSFIYNHINKNPIKNPVVDGNLETDLKLVLFWTNPVFLIFIVDFTSNNEKDRDVGFSWTIVEKDQTNDNHAERNDDCDPASDCASDGAQE